MYRDDAVERMKGYFDEKRFIEHTLKVLSRAEEIASGEGLGEAFIENVVVLGSVFHDIGIPEALQKHGSMDAAYQEKEGPPVARRIMEEMGVRPDILERVCYIVGNHHTAKRVDGMDFQAIWEADFIVNVDEKNITLDPEKVDIEVKDNIKTKTGRKLVAEVL
jgi:HD superfamily phosphodiesterase